MTRSVAAAYGKLDKVGTIEAAKHADLVILDAALLKDVAHYGRIAKLIKGGAVVTALDEPPDPHRGHGAPGAEALMRRRD